MERWKVQESFLERKKLRILGNGTSFLKEVSKLNMVLKDILCQQKIVYFL